MTKFVMLIGLPGVGKSTIAEKISKEENAIILSSDELRKELLGNEESQDKNGFIFEEMHRRARQYLKSGKNVIFDATNINSKRRIATLQQMPECEKICYYLSASYETCVCRNWERERNVPEEVIERMYKTLQIPMYHEGWNKIIIVNNEDDYSESIFSLKYYKDKLENVILNSDNYDELFTKNLISCIFEFKQTYDLPHDSSYHSFSVSRHIYHVYEYIKEKYSGEDKLKMLWAALLHDIGKPFCKNFKPNSRYANFIGHENVSAQLAIFILLGFNYNDRFIIDIATLVQLHMRIDWEENQKNDKQLIEKIGKDLFDKLKVLREADKQAK